MIANHPIYGHNYSYHIKGDRSPLKWRNSEAESWFYLEFNTGLFFGLIWIPEGLKLAYFQHGGHANRKISIM